MTSDFSQVSIVSTGNLLQNLSQAVLSVIYSYIFTRKLFSTSKPTSINPKLMISGAFSLKQQKLNQNSLANRQQAKGNSENTSISNGKYLCFGILVNAYTVINNKDTGNDIPEKKKHKRRNDLTSLLSQNPAHDTDTGLANKGTRKRTKEQKS